MTILEKSDLIAILLPDLRAGGAERVVINLANELVERGYAVDLVLMKLRGEFMTWLDARVRIVDLDVSRARYSVRPLAKYLRHRDPCALIANMWPLGLIALFAKWVARSRTTLCAVEHTTWSSSTLFSRFRTRLMIRTSMRMFYPMLDHVVTVSNGAAADLSRVSGLRAQRISVIYNPIVGTAENENAAPTATPEFAAWGGKDGSYRILAVGTLAPVKNFSLLLNAFALLRSRLPVRLIILGEGEERASLEDQVVELGMGHDVTLPGFVGDPDCYYRAADVLALSSDCEGLPTVIVEALARGISVVSTDCPSGPREVLEGGRFGTLVPVGDASALAQALELTLLNRMDPDVLKARAGDFGISRAVDEYLALLGLSCVPEHSESSNK